MEKEIIKIETNADGSKAVSARELHKFLESKQEFANWIKNRIEKYRFVEGQDYQKLYFDVEGNLLIISVDKFIKSDNQIVTKASKIEYVLTLDMAKELSMLENNEKGKEARRYFIECEKRLVKQQHKLPQTYKEALIELLWKVEENEKLQLENTQQKQIIGELQPKAAYYDEILKSQDCLTITQIAKDYGMSGHQLNQFLSEQKIQYKQSKQWLLYSNYHREGYTKSETVSITHKDGTTGSVLHTKWTQKGRLFLYELLKRNNILPLIEQEDGLAQN